MLEKKETSYIAVKDIKNYIKISEGVIRKYIKILKIETFVDKILYIKREDLKKIKEKAESNIEYIKRRRNSKKYNVEKGEEDDDFEKDVKIDEQLKRKERWRKLFVPKLFTEEYLEKLFDPKWMPQEQDLIPSCFLEE